MTYTFKHGLAVFEFDGLMYEFLFLQKNSYNRNDGYTYL